MDIYAKKGTKVKFLNYNGRESDLEYAQRYLEAGSEYTVDYTIVSGWSTDVVLEEFPCLKFNSVMFEEIIDKAIPEEEVYYRVLKEDDNSLHVVCMQWFDEEDYDQDKFAKDDDGNPLKFDSELEAEYFIHLVKKLVDSVVLSNPAIKLNSYIKEEYGGQLISYYHNKTTDLYAIMYNGLDGQTYMVNITSQTYNNIIK